MKTPGTALLLLTLAAAAVAAPAQPSPAEIPRVSTPPRLEDFLNGTSPPGFLPITDFRQRNPGDGTPVSEETTAYLSYDDQNLYVVFVCRDDPSQVRARMVKREDIFGDDFVGVILDTFQDRRRAYLFLTNPLGIQADGTTDMVRGDDMSFDTLWHSEGRLTPDGFAVWMAIPFKSLRFSNEHSQAWGIALARVISRRNETVFWPYITHRIQSFFAQMGTVQGMEGISAGRNLQFIPYGTFTGARFLENGASAMPQFEQRREPRAGLDTKVVLRDAFTLDLTLNPDFSQVESDEPQVTINERFEVFFPEKRPFFIENNSFFQTAENLFFSRRIVDPQYGARLTGKVGNWAMGGLLIDDQASGTGLPETHPLQGKRAGIGVFRIQREFAQESSVGVFISSRDFASGANRVFAVDTRLRLNPNWSFDGQAITAHTETLEGDRLSGPSYSAQLLHSGRHFRYFTRYLDRSPDFRSQVGFIPRVDMRQVEQSASYAWRPEKSQLLSFGPDISGLVNWDRKGRLQDWRVTTNFFFELAGNTVFRIERAETFELFQDLGFRKEHNLFFGSSDWLKWLGVSASYRFGTNVNFFPAPGLSPFLADFGTAFLQLRLRPTSRFRWDPTYIYTRLHSSSSIFNNHIVRSKLNYQFTRELSLRLILDYHAVLPNLSLVALDRAKQLKADILLTYLINPWTALYLGYTDQYENLFLLSETGPALRTNSPDLSTGRQFFVKLSYLFRF